MINHRLLFVDDEQGIIDSLERLFMEEDYEIETAISGKEALKKMGNNNFSLIISDQRMPEMTGAEFLQKAKELSPETIRIMLTGYSDIKDAVSAINKGEVYKYINKPWDDDELKLIVKQSLKHYELISENRELHALVKERNEELKEINKNLEQKVKERTHQLEQNFITSIRVFTGLISKSDDVLGKHSKRVSVLARRLAEKMNLPDKQVLDIEIAGLIHDIGTIGMPKRIFSRYTRGLSKNELAQRESHPIMGQEMIKDIEELRNVGIIIRHHHECYDGSGYPDGLREDRIPLETRILTVVDTYDLEANVHGQDHKASPQLATEYLRKRRGGIFDPEIVDVFLNLLEEIKDSKTKEVPLIIRELEEGMKLSRNLVTRGGVLLKEKDSFIKERDIEIIKHHHAKDPILDKIYVYKQDSV